MVYVSISQQDINILNHLVFWRPKTCLASIKFASYLTTVAIPNAPRKKRFGKIAMHPVKSSLNIEGGGVDVATMDVLT